MWCRETCIVQVLVVGDEASRALIIYLPFLLARLKRRVTRLP